MNKQELKELTNEKLLNLLSEAEWLDKDLLQEYDERRRNQRIEFKPITKDIEEYIKNKYAAIRIKKQELNKLTNEELNNLLNNSEWSDKDLLKEFGERLQDERIDIKPIFKELKEYIKNKYIQLQRKKIILKKLSNDELYKLLKEEEWLDKDLLKEYDERSHDGRIQFEVIDNLEEHFRKRRERLKEKESNQIKKAS